MIRIDALSKVFGDSAENEVVALKDVSLEIADYEFVSLIGASGCGKTTLLKIIDGLLPATSGRVLINDQVVTAPGPDRAVVFQDFALLPWASAADNVAFGLEMRGVGKQERLEVANHYLGMVGLKGFEDRLPHHLSGGMQQRVGLARALAVNPDVLLMDEPFGALDAQTRHLLHEDVLELWERDRKTVIFVTHDMDEAVYLSDRVIIMAPRPGTVAEELQVDLPRPRTEDVRRSPEYGALTAYVWETLRDVVRLQQQEGVA